MLDDKIKKALYLLFAGGMIASTLGFLLSVILLKLYGANDFGKYVLYQSYILFFASVFSLQTWQPLIKELISSEMKRNVFIGFFIPEIIFSFIGLIVAYKFQQLFFNFFNINEASYSLMMLSPIIFLQNSSFFGVFRFYNKHFFVNLVQISNVSLTIILGTILFSFGMEIFLNYIYTVYAITFLIAFFLSMLLLNKENNSVSLITINGIRKSIRLSFPFYVTSLTDIPIRDATLFFVNKYCGIEITSFYRILMQFSSLLSKVSLPIYQASYPEMVLLSKDKKNNELTKLIKNVTFLSFILISPIALLLIATYDYWIPMFFSESYKAFKEVFVFFMLIYALSGVFVAVHPAFVVICSHKLMVYITLFSNVMYLIVLIILAPFLGVWGILIACFCQISLVIGIKYKVIRSEIRK
ncbi:lipopolysaccharide biosynthesis protein [Photobacterium leiognathi]|uniref:lipopolysaccharide biosynthesis protein n=1 Tax=Photobacterium leiognathi TaxID=553611 RepID=UPI00076A7737|nr:hypothetical protein [Photobacterium leiognathi]